MSKHERKDVHHAYPLSPGPVGHNLVMESNVGHIGLGATSAIAGGHISST